MSILQGRLIQRGGGHPEKVTRVGIKSVDIGNFQQFDTSNEVLINMTNKFTCADAMCIPT